LGGVELSEFCREGYTGPMCAVCTKGYASTGSGEDLECQECNGSTTAVIAAGSAAFFLVFGFFAYRLLKMKGSVLEAIEAAADGMEKATDAYEDNEVVDKFGFVSSLKEKVRRPLGAIARKFPLPSNSPLLLAQYQPPAKIILSYFQIVSGL
jgi:hypothetical protein